MFLCTITTSLLHTVQTNETSYVNLSQKVEYIRPTDPFNIY